MSDPLLDVVMLVHDQPAWTEMAILAVQHFTRNPYRLVLVDMASELPETAAVLERARKAGHTVVVLDENRSFSNGVNAGVSVTTALGGAPVIVLLNSDAIVTEGWDAALLQDTATKTVGLVGARSNYASGAQGDPSFAGEPPFLVFVCVALRRDVWETVGPLDEHTFDGFSSEDLDYSWRVVKAGYRLKVSNAFVLHAGSRTLAATVGDVHARSRNDLLYNARLIEKWGKEWVIAHSKLKQNVFFVTFHAEEWTRVSFMGSVLGTRRSDGYGYQFFHQQRAPIQMARQLVMDYATDNHFDVAMMIDDDATFPSDVVRRLLAHEKPVVTALAYQRKKPHPPCVYEIGPDGMLGAALDGIEDTGLRRVDCSGLHVSAIRTDVIRQLRAAGIKQYFGGFDNKLGEDFAFCVNLKKIGVPVYCDTGLDVGHLGESINVDKRYRRAFVAAAGGPVIV